MTTDAPGLREAINRLRRIKAGEDPFLVYGHMMTDDTRAVHPFHQREFIWERQQDDHETIADDWLATHPSDGGEAISEEWLREIGGKWSGPGPRGGVYVFTNENGATLDIGRDRHDWLVRLGVEGDGGQWPEHMEIRPQLLHLLAALGCGIVQPTNSGKAG